MRQIYEVIRTAGPSDASVLIEGESGTGKELIATAFHLASRRSARPIIRINCAAIPHDLIESELFGYKKGAFTGADRDKRGLIETADGGTLLLDEIAEMPLHLQTKLLRVLQDRRVRRLGDET
jgi:transcriptional regulator with PAS, ATPase and Fis domain